MRNRRRFATSMERLEHRLTLSAMADFVFLLDESGSQRIGKREDGEALRPWVSQIVDDLEHKFVSRGIGASPNAQNRYGVIAFGKNGARALTIDDEFFASHDKVTFMMTQFVNEGGDEDGYEAIALAVGNEDVISNYEFREGAAVHLILVSDEERESPSRIGAFTSSDQPLFFNLLEQFRKEKTGLLNDIVLTTVNTFGFDELHLIDPFAFHPDLFAEEFSPTILGIDLDVADSIDLDINHSDPNHDLINASDHTILFTHRATTNTLDNPPEELEFKVDVIENSESSPLFDPGVGYQQIRQAFANACRTIEDCPADQYASELHDQDESIIGQENFESEVYAFITWEARGTAWDFHVIQEAFQGWNNPDDYDDLSDLIIDSGRNFRDLEREDSLIHAFNRSFVDDLFEKTRLQIANFDMAPETRMPEDFRAYAESAMTAIALPETIGRIDQFDLDNDKQFVDPLEPKIDPDDVRLLTTLFAIPVGDSNLDFRFNTSDLIRVFQAGEYEDQRKSNSTWLTGDWNGDFEFNSRDFVIAFRANTFENGPLDADQNGCFDYLPVWASALQDRNDPNSRFYVPNWG